MSKTIMEKAQEVILELSEKTGILSETIRKDDLEVLALFQYGSEINEKIGLAWIPLFDNMFAKEVLMTVTPQSYEDIRKLRAFFNDGDEWVYTTLEMLKRGVIGIQGILANAAISA